jgi:hypothetical protein
VTTGRYQDVYKDLVFYLRSIQNPLIILDEAGDLEYPAFLELKALWNATDRSCGWYMMGADGLKAKIERNLEHLKVGYAEILSRMGNRFQKITPSGTDKTDFIRQQVHLIGVANGIVIILSSLALLLVPRERIQIWAAILIFTGMGGMVFWSLPHPYRAQEDAKRSMGRELREAITATGANPKTVYKDSRIVGLYSECYYMGFPVKVVKKIADIPMENKDSFLISTEFPLDPNRIWTNLLPEKKRYRREKLYLWHGVINEKKLLNHGNGFSTDNLSLDE